MSGSEKHYIEIAVLYPCLQGVHAAGTHVFSLMFKFKHSFGGHYVLIIFRAFQQECGNISVNNNDDIDLDFFHV